MTKEEGWFILANLPDLIPSKLLQLMERFPDPQEILNGNERLLAACLFLTEKEKQQILCGTKEDRCRRELDRLRENGTQFVYRGHSDYPERFRVIPETPPYFFYKGKLPDPSQYAVGMVGARACSPYGKAVSFRFAKQLAEHGVQIISGMAAGVDAWSSRGAIDGGGTTFVVLGTGIDVIYPMENFGLYYDIIEHGGGVISEFLPGTKGLPWQFPHRNRLISALSDKVLIMEARSRSGTLTTAQHALTQGIDIYALPGKINDPLSEGCNRLISEGCGILLNVEDFLLDLFARPVRCLPRENASYPEYDPPKAGGFRAVQGRSGRKLSVSGAFFPEKKPVPETMARSVSCGKEAQQVLGCLTLEPQSAEVLLKATDLSLQDLLAALSELMICGLVEEVAKDCFVRTI